MRIRILFISPSAEDARTLSRMLGAIPADFFHALNWAQAIEYLQRESFQAILTEARLPDADWSAVVRYIEQSGLKTAVIVTHRLADGKLWVDVLEGGAYDLLPQPFYAGEVQRIVRGAIKQSPSQSTAAPAA